MCNRYTIKASPAQLTEDLRAVPAGELLFDAEVFPKGTAPALLLDQNGQREIHSSRFGLIPHGKSPATQRYPNNNARIESLSRWPWKGPITRRRCVLPLNRFQEPCYWGETAGKEVTFYSPEEPYLFVAGVYELFSAPPTPTVTMAFLMRPACEYVMEYGHHRQPFFLAPDQLDVWMRPEQRTIEDCVRILHDSVFEPRLDYEVVREMAPSWKSRQKKRLAERDKQLAEINANGALGC